MEAEGGNMEGTESNPLLDAVKGKNIKIDAERMATWLHKKIEECNDSLNVSRRMSFKKNILRVKTRHEVLLELAQEFLSEVQ